MAGIFDDLIPSQARSKGVLANGLLPGREGNLNPAGAGDNWATFEVSQNGIPAHLVLPTQPGDKPPNDASGFMGTAVERYLKTDKHYGAFDTDEAGAAFMNQKRQAQSDGGMFDDLIPKSSPADNWSRIGAESLDQAGIRPNAEQPQAQGGILRNLRAGATEAVTGTLDMLADPGAGEEMRALGLDRNTVPSLGPGERQHAVNRALGEYNPESVPAVTSTDRLARAAGYGAAMVGSPELFMARGPSLAAKLIQVGKAAMTGGAAGVGGEVGSETGQALAPEGYKTAAGFAGGLVGGGVGSLTTQVPRAIGAAGRLAARAAGPVTEAGAQRIAGERIASSATNPDQVRQSLRDVRELVPGSQATTFQATGDMGLGSLERDVQTQYPAEFAERRAQQNSARIGQLERLQPNGSAADLSDYVRGQMQWLDQQTEQDVASATRLAQQRVEALGGNQPAEHYGAELRLAGQQAEDLARGRERALWKAVDPDGNLAIDAKPVRAAADDILGSLTGSARPPAGDEKMILDIARGYTPTVPFRDVGDLRSWVSDALRTELRTNGQTQTYARLSRLRSAIQDAINGAVEVRAQQAPDELYNELAGFEQSYRAKADRWQEARRGAATRDIAVDASGARGIPSGGGAQGESDRRPIGASSNPRISPSVGRSSSLLQTIARMGGIRTQDGAGNITREGQEITNLLRDYNRPGLVNNRTGLPPDEVRKLLQDEGWFGRSERFGPTALAAGEHPGDNLQELYDAIDREARGERVYHPEAQARGQRYDPAQHEQYLAERAARAGVPRLHGWSLRDWEDALNEREAMRGENAQPFDTAARERLSSATQATRERADTFGRGPVSQVLAKAGRQDQYRLSNASVPAKVFTPGPGGAEAVQSYRNAVGDPQALLTLQDYAASNLRQYAGRIDGTLDPTKVQAWAQRHEPALGAFPELHKRFRDASAASEAIGEAMAARRTALDAYQTGVFSKVVGVSNPEDVTRAIGGILNSQSRVQQMQQLGTTARRDPNAFAGLRKGIADYIAHRFTGNTEAGTSGLGALKSDAFQTFMKQNETALRSVFSPDEISSLKAIAADLQRSNRSLTAVKTPGQSNTAQDLAQLAKGQPSILRRLLIEGASATAGWFTAGPAGSALGWLGSKTIGALRDAGFKRVDDIVKAAMLNPELARALLEKAPAKPDAGSAWRLTQALRKAALMGATAGATSATAQPQPSPGLTQAATIQAPEVVNALATPQQNAFAGSRSMPAANALMGNSGAPVNRNALAPARGNSTRVTDAPPPPWHRSKAVPEAQSGTSASRTPSSKRAAAYAVAR